MQVVMGGLTGVRTLRKKLKQRESLRLSLEQWFSARTLHPGDIWKCLEMFCHCNWEGILLIEARNAAGHFIMPRIVFWSKKSITLR